MMTHMGHENKSGAIVEGKGRRTKRWVRGEYK